LRGHDGIARLTGMGVFEASAERSRAPGLWIAWLACVAAAGAVALGCATARAPAALPDFDALWNYDDPAATEVALRELLPQARASGDRDYLAQLLTQIARTQSLQQRFDDAHTTLDEAEGLLPAGASVARVRTLLERGRTFNSAGSPERARGLFLEAFQAARSMGDDPHAVDAAHMLGIVEAPEAAREWNHRALALAESSDDPRARDWLGSLYQNMGYNALQEERYHRALALFERLIEWSRERGGAPQEEIGRWFVGRTYRAMGRVEEALALQEALLAECGDSTGYTHEEIAECLLALGRDREAQPHFAAAYERLSRDSWLAETEPERLERLKRLGEGTAK